MLWGKKYDDRLDGINEATIPFFKMLSVVFSMNSNPDLMLQRHLIVASVSGHKALNF